MLLITEFLENTTEVQVIQEANGKKSRYITGIFAQAEKPNRNKRTYPKALMEREINLYQDKIAKKQAMGELNHPNSPTVNPERASHLITELKFSGNDVYGKAKIIPTPVGRIVETLLDEGIQLGVSTRGMGSLKNVGENLSEVQGDFTLNAIDIVSDPSGVDCWVNGIMEGAEWVFQNGTWRKAEQIQQVLKSSTLTEINNHKLKLFENYLKNLS